MTTEKTIPLEIELLQVDSLLFGRVKNMDESLRNTSTFFELDGVIIASSGDPALYPDGNACPKKTNLYIRGSNRRMDHKTFVAMYKTEKEATVWAEKIKHAVEKFNEDPLYSEPNTPTTPLKCKRIMG